MGKRIHPGGQCGIEKRRSLAAIALGAALTRLRPNRI
jgi:hypothetical protein